MSGNGLIGWQQLYAPETDSAEHKIEYNKKEQSVNLVKIERGMFKSPASLSLCLFSGSFAHISFFLCA